MKHKESINQSKKKKWIENIENREKTELQWNIKKERINMLQTDD